jgi:hypothetical protein
VKRKTFYFVSLFLPYVALAFGGALSFLVYEVGLDSNAFDGPLSILAGTVMFFSVSAIIWGPLYTWAVILMLFWGRGKPADELRRAYLLLPVLLACSMGIPALLFYMDSSIALLAWGFLHLANLDFLTPLLLKNTPLEEALIVSVAWVFMAAVCLVVGYLFVGIVLLVERILKRRYSRRRRIPGKYCPFPRECLNRYNLSHANLSHYSRTVVPRHFPVDAGIYQSLPDHCHDHPQPARPVQKRSHRQFTRADREPALPYLLNSKYADRRRA